MQQPDELARQQVVLLMDDLHLRRAAVESLLTPWADGFGASIELGQMADFESEPLGGKAMVLVNIGDASVSRAGLDVSLRQLVDRSAGTPVVVISDRDDPGEMAQALEAGVRGFVPASTAPDLALKALTFILNGGHFFPPSVLHPVSRRTRLTVSGNSPDLPTKPGRGFRHAVRIALRFRQAGSSHRHRILRLVVRFRGSSRPRQSEAVRTIRLPQLSRRPLRKAARKGSIM